MHTMFNIPIIEFSHIPTTGEDTETTSDTPATDAQSSDSSIDVYADLYQEFEDT